jgi:dienelactone hydrolase
MRRRTTNLAGMMLLLGLCGRAPAAEEPGPPLPGTKPLTRSGDIASELVAGVDRFLLRQIDESTAKRPGYWKRDLSSAEAYAASVEPNRKRLAHILGARDQRVSATRIRRSVGPDGGSGEMYNKDKNSKKSIQAVSWPAFGDVTGEGLELGGGDLCVIVVPDADQTPEQIAGLVQGVPSVSQVARRLADANLHVFVPMLIDRTVSPRNGRAKLTSREFVYRSAFELGRHLIGYEVQKVLALVDALERESRDRGRELRVGIFGYGEGGAIALYAASLDRRIKAACVSGYYGDRNDVWRQPVDRNVFGLLEQFGDAEVASLVAPRALIVEAAGGPEFVIPPGTGGAPGRLTTPGLGAVTAEVERARGLVAGLDQAHRIELVASGPNSTGPFGTDEALAWLLRGLDPAARLESDGPAAAPDPGDAKAAARLVEAGRDRQARQLHELDRHNQQLLVESPYTREAFMKKLDTRSAEAYARSVEPYRELFAEEVIGRFDLKPLPPEVRSRRIYDEPGFTGYEVLMDVFPDVIAYGILLVPKGIRDGERRPVVVCQHGLEGRPRDVADPRVEKAAYHRYAVRLAERGFVTFAPQNLYIFEDRFRTLQRKANPIKKTLFSVIVPQHQQITDWLKALPFVDPDRIAFYGLSYGGKSAMRIPPLVKNYCLSICSADFNEWVWKNASTRSPYSYVWSGEYEIFEFDLGSTFNYAEMAALIAPRPFMVERGHFDGVAPDETVAYEFAKVFHLYDAKLGIGDRCRIEFFVGPHTINGKGTFDFLHQHLNWPKPGEDHR